MIELKDVRKVYNAGKPSEFVALDGIDLSLEAGRVTVLKGPSGSGEAQPSPPAGEARAQRDAWPHALSGAASIGRPAVRAGLRARA